MVKFHIFPVSVTTNSHRTHGTGHGIFSLLFFLSLPKNKPELMADNILEYTLGKGAAGFTFGRDCPLPFPVIQPHQTHSSRVACITDPDISRDSLQGVDALVTGLEGVSVGVRTADCIPVLLYDPVARAVGAVHSGWRGTADRIASRAVEEMARLFGSSPRDIRAAIGPGIGFDSFQVGEELVDIFSAAGFPMDRIWNFRGARKEGSMSGGHHIDLKECVRITLMESGLNASEIQVSEIDTYTDLRFYSARREGSRCGRNINAVMLSGQPGIQ